MKKSVSTFTSLKEKRLWLWSFAVVLAIFATLFIGRPLADQLRDQNVQAVFFLCGMLLVGGSILAHGLLAKPGKVEVSIWLGIVAVYALLIFRLGAPERSHLIEYGVLAVFVHKAFMQRQQFRKLPLKPALLAMIVAFLVGVLDEFVQKFLPNRVFDPEDILFNGLAVSMAIGTSVLLTWLRRRFEKQRT